jgi:hypothetical protein
MIKFYYNIDKERNKSSDEDEGYQLIPNSASLYETGKDKRFNHHKNSAVEYAINIPYRLFNKFLNLSNIKIMVVRASIKRAATNTAINADTLVVHEVKETRKSIKGIDYEERFTVN